ncbi:hypothetical protein BJS_07003 [Bradyrhizobium japonicum SEMIA 5079]|nr:hypothetical protein BJS_07003 [Bradyrhizobium japonicum SEMIA 5079]
MFRLPHDERHVKIRRLLPRNSSGRGDLVLRDPFQCAHHRGLIPAWPPCAAQDENNCCATAVFGSDRPSVRARLPGRQCNAAR